MHRRTLLGLLGVAGLPVVTGCTSGGEPTPTPTSSSADVDEAVRSRVAAEEAELLARYEATITAHPALAPMLTPWADHHRVHRDALASTPAAPTPAVSADAATALTDLLDAERAAAQARTSACEEATSVDLARLLALIAASEAGHAEALQQTSATGTTADGGASTGATS